MSEHPAVRRHSLLARNLNLTRSEFSSHYETFHGPLAAGLPGFRRYATRYLQNHVEPDRDMTQTLFDGVTMTTQVRRNDYSVGFFTDPDYEKVKSDEQYLFDISKTVSVLGKEGEVKEGPRTRWKALVLGNASTTLPDTAVRVELNHLDVSTASALGFGEGVFTYDLLAELWFASQAERAAVDVGQDKGRVFLPVREVLVYGPEKPWNES